MLPPALVIGFFSLSYEGTRSSINKTDGKIDEY